jgi:hypothetical protein
LKIINTSSEDVQELLAMVHRNVYDAPAVPEKFGVALFASLILPPDPLLIVHVPVPIEGVFPERVTVVNPQVTELVISVPAFAGNEALVRCGEWRIHHSRHGSWAGSSTAGQVRFAVES